MESPRETLEDLGLLTRDTQAKIQENLKKTGTAVVEIEGRRFIACLNQAGQIVVEFKQGEFLLPETVREKLRISDAGARGNAFEKAFLNIAAAVQRMPTAAYRPEEVLPCNPRIEKTLDEMVALLVSYIKPLPVLSVASDNIHIRLGNTGTMSSCMHNFGSYQEQFIRHFEAFIEKIATSALYFDKQRDRKNEAWKFKGRGFVKWGIIYRFFQKCAAQFGNDIPPRKHFPIRIDDTRLLEINIQFKDWNNALSYFKISVNLD